MRNGRVRGPGLLTTEQDSLWRLAEAIAGRIGMDELFAFVAHEAGVLLGADSAVIVRVDDPGQASVVGAWNESHVGELFDLHRPSSVREALRTGATTRTRHGHERVAAPIYVGDRVWGAISVGTLAHAAFPADTEERLERHTPLVAIAIAEGEARGDSLHRFEQQKAIASLSAFALASADLTDVLQHAVDLVAETLHVEIAGVGQLDAAAGEVVLHAAFGPVASRGARMQATTSTLAGLALASSEPIVANDLRDDPRFRGSRLVAYLGAGSGASTVIRTQAGDWGVITLVSARPRRFETSDAQFLAQIADVLAMAIDRARAEERIRHDATHDELTGLANRTLLVDRISFAVERARGATATIAVIACDVDRFKNVNDLYGRDVGDELVVEIAARLRACIGPAHTLARLEGDEFVVACEGLTGEGQGLAVASGIVRSFDEPFTVANGIRVSASVGLVVSGRRASRDSLLRDAGTAMYRAKAAGRGQLEIFNPVMRRRIREAAILERDLSHALERDELILRYQPIVATADGSIVAFEALLRWQHPTRGLLAPGLFIPIAEESRLIIPIGRWTITEAARRASLWNAAYPDGRRVGMNVNLSPLQLGDPGLLSHLEDTIARFACAPRQLGLEITETVLLESNSAHADVLRRASEAGVRLLLDDFGIGYSSLASLQKLPLDALKLDRSFVTDVTSSNRDAAIVTAMVRMAEELGIDVVAEGVETRLQHAKLKLLGCLQVQGYYYARPLTSERAELLLEPGGNRMARRATAA